MNLKQVFFALAIKALLKLLCFFSNTKRLPKARPCCLFNFDFYRFFVQLGNAQIL